MPMILVDGQEIDVKEGENILEACLNAGLDQASNRDMYPESSVLEKRIDGGKDGGR